MGKPYTYLLRPGYGSDKLLLEFILDSSDTEFVKDLFTTLKDISPTIDSVADLWMNDEVLFSVSSAHGGFLLSKDIWDLAFLTAEENQSCLKLIDAILTKSSSFEKQEVDFRNYENVNT